MALKLRNGLTQTIVVGMICFTGPGMFNALTALGGAGLDDPFVANLSNAALYFSFFVSGFFGSALFNTFGNRALFVFGGLSYALYASAHLLVGNNPQLSFLAIASGGLLGVGAASLWTAQGAAVVAYAPPSQEARYISLFWSIFSLGGCVGGLLMCISNWNNVGKEKTRANVASYTVMLVAMFTGPLLSVTLLRPTREVVRTDGQIVQMAEKRSPGREFLAIVATLFDRNMHYMAPYFIMSNLWYAYLFNGINDTLFNIRTRSFNSSLFWLTQMFGTKLSLRFLDHSATQKQHTGKRCFWFLAVYANIVFSLGAILQYCFKNTDKVQPPGSQKIDIIEVGRLAYPLTVLLAFGLLDSLVQTYGLWMNSGLSNSSIERMAQYSGFSKSVQSLGSTLSWLIDGTGYSYTFQLFMCWGFFVASLPTLFLALNKMEKSCASSLKDDYPEKAADEATPLTPNIKPDAEPIENLL